MKKEEIVCSLEQAKRLNELGVAQNSYFHHRKYTYSQRRLRYPGSRPAPDPGYIWEDIDSTINLGAGHALIESFSAFTLSELGLMIPPKILAAEDEESVPRIWQLFCGKDEEDGFFSGYFKHGNLGKFCIRLCSPMEVHSRAALAIWLIEKNHTRVEDINLLLIDSIHGSGLPGNGEPGTT